MNDRVQWTEGLLQNHLFLERAEGCVKVQEKSTSPVFNLREVFEHCTESYSPGGERLKVVLKVLSTVSCGEPAGSRTQTLTLFMPVHGDNARKRVPREAYLVIRARLARLSRKAGLVGRFIFASLACHAHLACLAQGYGVGFGEDEEVERVRSASCSASFFLMSCNSFLTSSRSESL
jgi:hypothetical protein